MSIETMKQAQDLRALADRFSEGWHDGIKIDASDIVLLATVASAIEQAQQTEPVAYIRVSKTGHVMACAKTENFFSLPHKTLLYTSPPPRQPLTDEEMFTIAKKIGFDSELMKLNHDRGMPSLAEQFARAIEAAHGIKENT